MSEVSALVKDEMQPEFRIVVVVNHDERRARNRIDAEAQLRIFLLGARMRDQKSLNDIFDNGTFRASDVETKLLLAMGN